MESIIARVFQEKDASEVSALIPKTLRITNSKDSTPEHIEEEYLDKASVI